MSQPPEPKRQTPADMTAEVDNIPPRPVEAQDRAVTSGRPLPWIWIVAVLVVLVIAAAYWF